MLSEDRNRQLTQVGPGTPMGEVLRRQPAHESATGVAIQPMAMLDL